MSDKLQRAKAGALWVRKSKKDGATFLSGEINVDGASIKVIGFKNKMKKPGDKYPDYQLFVSEDRPRNSAPEKPKASTTSHSSETDGEVEL